jgi:hypothetical protein
MVAFYLNLVLNTLRLRYEPNMLMRSIGLLQCFITITKEILEIILSSVFYLKQILYNNRNTQETHYVSDTYPTG